MKNLQAQITAVNDSIRDLEREAAHTEDKEICSELLMRRNALIKAMDTLKQVEQIRDGFKAILE